MSTTTADAKMAPAALFPRYEQTFPELTSQEIARMRELLDTLPKPTLAFCRSGTRSGNLIRQAAALAAKR